MISLPGSVPLLEPVPLFGPVPGGMELFVIFIMALMMFGLPLTIFGGLFVAHKRSKEDMEELKREVSELREQVEANDRER
ncbi:hypothetical protein SAMN05421858_1008 [Haladaptatus litoreus]|uniref:Uncharacterized protein n=1 Tax=Haladaptatus litoreus TaxID=553468 RepID=A0A1N6X6H0_9EURY|nr:hypothetical protein [Haladaptatus litoreus]SIQ97952.1 hypothetical protein SAMN05421858_1008 [Haladaptatus litoreus]